MLGRPHVAEVLEAVLRESPGVGLIRTNVVTGRLLIHHDLAMSSNEVDQLLREAIVLTIRQVVTPPQYSRREPSGMGPRVGHQHYAAPSFAVAGSATVALAALSRSLRRSPLARLGALLVATAGIVRRAWRNDGRSRQASTVALRTIRHPLLRIVGTHKRQFYTASTLSILVQILDMAPALIIGWMVVVLITGRNTAVVRFGLVTASSQLSFLTGVIALVCVVFIVSAALSYIENALWRNLAQSVQHEWLTTMYAHVQKVELAYLEGERTTRITTVLTDDINQLGRFFVTSTNDLLQLGTSFLVLILMFLSFAPNMAWIALLPVPVIAWFSFFYKEHSALDYATNSEDVSLLNSQLVNNLEASATVKSFCAEDYEIERIRRLSEACRQSNHRIDKRAAAYTPIIRVCTTLSLGGMLLLGGRAVLAGAIPFEVFGFLIGLPQRVLLQHIPKLGDAVDQYQRSVAALGRMLDLLSLPVESGEMGDRLDMAAVRGELVLDRVTFAYPGRPPVLQDLSLRFPSKKTTGIVGVTGAGKTTIAKLLLRFQHVTSGRVLLDGVDISDLRLQDLRTAVGFVAQEDFLFDGTVEDNIRYGRFDANPERVVGAARLAKADGFVEALPLRYNTMVGERGAMLSGGQKQRLSLARAILKSAPIIILDEATSAVDNETEAAIQRALKVFAKDRTMLIIAHRLSTIRHADWIYVMGKGGVVAEEGTHHELVLRGGVYASLWHLQSGETTA